MWFWTFELKAQGFRKRSEHLWLCESRHGALYGLQGEDHLAIFDWSPRGSQHLEIQAFHITFLREGHHIHFYYRELEEARWAPEGHTDVLMLHDLGLDKVALCQDADAIAARWVHAVNAQLLPRT